jgi:hypothetical protein
MGKGNCLRLDGGVGGSYSQSVLLKGTALVADALLAIAFLLPHVIEFLELLFQACSFAFRSCKSQRDDPHTFLR